MPCGELTERQCKLRDAMAKKLIAKGVKGDAWAIATAKVKAKKEAGNG